MKGMTAPTASPQVSLAVRVGRSARAPWYPGKNLAAEAVLPPASEAEREAEVARFASP